MNSTTEYVTLISNEIFTNWAICYEVKLIRKFIFVFSEELRLQRNPDSYALLRRYDVTSGTG
jgi:hypothetical protein